jgi:hypothetical protein
MARAMLFGTRPGTALPLGLMAFLKTRPDLGCSRHPVHIPDRAAQRQSLVSQCDARGTVFAPDRKVLGVEKLRVVDGSAHTSSHPALGTTATRKLMR